MPESVPATRSSSRFLLTGLLTAGLSLAAAAQWILEKRPPLRFGGRALHDALAPVWPHPGAVLLSLAIFAVATVSFVAAARRFVPPPALPPPRSISRPGTEARASRSLSPASDSSSAARSCSSRRANTNPSTWRSTSSPSFS